MKRKIRILILFTFCSVILFAQSKPLTYYLPDINYDKKIPTPQEFLGYQIGDWHISHDQLTSYMKTLAELSPRVTFTEYARSYENRPLFYLTITSEKNYKDLEEIKTRHLQLADPANAASVDISKQPVVVYQGYCVHGNEASAGNAAPLVAYYLAAGKSKEVENLLDDGIFLIDPCFNPDGFNRFANWTNVHKNNAITTDPNDREYNEVWPGGRTNHYWFDLNRDWLPVQHPESQGRVDVFHQWQPNVLTDHHEMGTNATFFFQPGIPQRVNPLTPLKNQELTAKIGEYHAAALETIGSLYFTEERYDDYYYGKGSTYPDVNGAIGILFEQASSRGKAQESDNGVIDFAFTVRNQVTVSLSTQKAAFEMREELLEFKRSFYQNAMQEAATYPRKAFVFGEEEDKARLNHFIEILLKHKIKVHQLARTSDIGGKQFKAANSYVVPLEQPQHRLIRAIFERNTTFKDSLFYDVSAWDFPLAFNIDFRAVDGSQYAPTFLGNEILTTPTNNSIVPDYSDYAYVMEWEDYYAPKALYQILNENLRAKVSTLPFNLGGKQFANGTIIVPVQNQDKSPDQLFQFMQSLARNSQVKIYDVDGGLSPQGPDLGSSYLRPLRLPNVLIMAGEGVTGYDAGENWFLLDQRYEIPATLREPIDIPRTDLSRYNVIVMPDGNYSTLNQRAVTSIKDWVRDGGVLITLKRATEWAQRNQVGFMQLIEGGEEKKESSGRRPYQLLEADNGRHVIGGSIFETRLDLSHPIGYGYQSEELPVFRKGSTFLKPTVNPYASPLVYTEDPLVSGYLSSKNKNLVAESAAIVITGLGRGRVVAMADNPNFRAYWYGTSKLFANAIYFGHIIDSRGIERAQAEE